MNGKALKGLEDLPRPTSKGLSSTSWVAHSSPGSTSGTIPHHRTEMCATSLSGKIRRLISWVWWQRKKGQGKACETPARKLEPHLPPLSESRQYDLPVSHEELPVCGLAGACSGRHHLQRQRSSLGSQWMRTLVLKESVEYWVNMEPLRGRELCKNRETKRSPPLVCWQNSPRLGEGTWDETFSFSFKSLFPVWHLLCCCCCSVLPSFWNYFVAVFFLCEVGR